MNKKLASRLLVIALLTQIVGCHSYQEITKEEFVQTEEYSDLRVRIKNQYTYEFYENDYTVQEDSIYGSGRLILKTGIEFNEDYTGSIGLKEIESFKLDRFNTMLTIAAIAGIAIGVGIIVFIASELSSMAIGIDM